ncbi:MAG TPA: alpha/beta hydrolase [Chroococcales cyanobacterium]
MSKVPNHPYFITPSPSNPAYPLFVFLPGMDETGKELMSIQTAGLEIAFDVRCLVIPSDEFTSWTHLSEQVIALTQAELEKTPRSSVYLCAESFGTCIALKAMLSYPQLFHRIILINSASSFHRVPWLNWGSYLFPWVPEFLYKNSSFMALPALTSLNRLSPKAHHALFQSVQDAPKQAVMQRLTLMREFDIDEMKLSQFTQPVLLIASEADLILPSVAEAKRLARILPNARIVTIPHKGHACLVEEGFDLFKILQDESFLENS